MERAEIREPFRTLLPCVPPTVASVESQFGNRRQRRDARRAPDEVIQRIGAIEIGLHFTSQLHPSRNVHATAAEVEFDFLPGLQRTPTVSSAACRPRADRQETRP